MGPEIFEEKGKMIPEYKWSYLTEAMHTEALTKIREKLFW